MIKKTQRLLFITARVTGVDVLVGVLVNKLDGASLETLLDGTTREGAVDLEALGDGGRGDKLEGGDLLHHAVIGVLVEGHHVVELLTDLTLGPFLQYWEGRGQKQIRGGGW